MAHHVGLLDSFLGSGVLQLVDQWTSTEKFVILVFTALILWLAVVRAFRWQRYDAVHRKYEAKWKAGMLTVADAQKILHVLQVYDMPLLINKAMGLALFKTYAIPTISKLLLATKELASPVKVSKRYADTELLVATMVGCPLSGFHDPHAVPDGVTPAEDPRASIALARMNMIHSKYKISNDDYLYTLSLFVLQPSVWAKRYGWRTVSAMEEEAMYILWKDIGEKMGIEEIPGSFAELAEWSQAYEEKYMVPASSNHDVAMYTLDELLYAVPRGPLRNFAEKLIIALLDERLRIAMLFPKQSWIIRTLVHVLMSAFWIAQRLLCLPRRDSDSGYIVDLGVPRPDANGEIRLRPTMYKSMPWYKEEPKGALSRAFARFLVRIGYYADVPSRRYMSEGYRIAEVGPHSFQGVGVEKVILDAERMQGCPISGAWAPKSSSNDVNVKEFA